MRSLFSGETRTGVVVALVATIIPLSFCLGAATPGRTFSVPHEAIAGPGGRRLCVPIPECESVTADFECEGRLLDAVLIETAYIRDQKIAVFELQDPLDLASSVDISLAFRGAQGEHCVDTGPLTRVCSRALVGYTVSPSTEAYEGAGTIAHCSNLSECRDARPDALLIAGHAIAASPYVDSLATLWIERMGLNVAVMDVADISVYSPIDIRNFIKNLYDYRCAEHFGDGHLGFVVLLGDAYEDDNTTRMIPEYDGYGGNAEASDHFYACVSGSDDYEDVMIGRIPVGNEQELISYYVKLASYSPLPVEDWTRSLLFAAGCFFSTKDDYVVYFDSLAAYVPSDYGVSRYYRYDFPHSDAGDANAVGAMIDSIDVGKLFLFYCGDGDKWDWGGRYERVFRSSNIASLDNAARLPIVFSISCSNGWFDNISNTYSDGGVDCLAERLVLAEEKGAIACLASSREAGGGASTVFTPEIIKAAFVNGSTFLGELILEAKTRHLIHLGNVVFARQFNLFGDPCLNFDLNDLPASGPDLTIRPYSVRVSPEFPTPGEPPQIEAEVWNAGGAPVAEFEVALYSGHPDSGGTILGAQTVTDFYAWERRTVSFAASEADVGPVGFYLIVDPTEAVPEVDEENNDVGLATYVYPCEPGFPIKIDDGVGGQVVADLNCDGKLDILVTSGGTQAVAVGFDGRTLWCKENMGLPQWFEGIEPSAFDLNGDGTVEAILTTRSALVVAEGLTGDDIWKRYTDYPVLSPIISDIDGDGLFEVLHGTFSFSYSKICAFNASGSYRWIHQVATYGEKLTGMVVCDIDFDGKKEIIFGTDAGNLTCLSCSTEPPATVWDDLLSPEGIGCLAGGDLDRDGTIEIVAGCGTTVYVLDAADGAVTDAIGCPAEADDIALGDLDSDTDLEIVCTSDGGRVFEIDNGSVVLDVDTEESAAGCASLADIDQDGASEIIVASEQGTVRILSPACGDVIPPIPMRGGCVSGPSVQDIDHDCNVEIVAGSSDSLLFILDLGTGGGRVEWSGYGGAGTRTGLYAEPLFGTVAYDRVLSGRIDAVGDIIVEAGASLIFQRGSDVRFVYDDVSPIGSSPGRCEILVAGSLIATGSQAAGVSLKPAKVPCSNHEWTGILVWPEGSATLTGVKLSGALTGIDCRTSSAYISECLITNCTFGIKLDEASPTVDHNTIAENDYGISANGSAAVIVGNMIKSNVYSGIVLSSSSNATLSGNRVRGTMQGYGVACYSSDPVIENDNRLEFNSLAGLYLSRSSPVIDSCYIASNGQWGIKVTYYSDPVIAKTSIVSNTIGVGVYLSSNPVLGDSMSGLGGFNDVRLNTSFAVYNATANEIKAQMNWWGTDDPDPGMFAGPVDYSGWLVLSPAGVGDIPSDIGLIQGLYPNPFASSIRLDLSAPEAQIPIDISIYDVTGRLVRSLACVDTPGEQRLEWDGRDTYGRLVTSGAYFITINSRTGAHTRKVILLR